MNMHGSLVHPHLVCVRAVVVALETVEMAAALLVRTCNTKQR